MGGMLNAGAAMEGGGLNDITAICCIMAIWLADNWFIAAVTSVGIVDVVVLAYVFPNTLPIIAAAVVCVMAVLLLLVPSSLHLSEMQ